MFVSVVQQCESATCTHISPPSWASLPPPLTHPSRSLQSTEVNFLCYTGCLFYMLYYASYAILAIYFTHGSVYLEKTMATHSSTLAWKTPWIEEPGRLQSLGSLRVRHDWATSLLLFTFMHWRRKWQPTPVFLPGESQGWRSLVGCHLWSHTELDTLTWLSSSRSSVYIGLPRWC